MAHPTLTPASSSTSRLRPEDDFELPLFPADVPLRPENEFDFDALLAHAEELRPLAMSSPYWEEKVQQKPSDQFVL